MVRPVPDRSSAVLHILSPGLFTTIQDLGRTGYRQIGMPLGGAMDSWSLRCANRLVGNPDHAAALEVTAVGPELCFASATRFAVTGASFRLTLNGKALSSWTATEAPPGARLTFGPRLAGARAYLAVAGGLDVPVVMGSRSTHVPSRIGGLDGRALRAGDVVSFGAAGSIVPPQTIALPMDFRPGFEPCPLLHLLAGPHEDRFAPEALTALTSAPYRLSSQSDRMGYRLEGPQLIPLDGGTMLSEPTPVGAIQVPPNRQPILLMTDCQTTGGYPQLAVLITADRSAAAQLLPGDQLRFALINRQEALKALAAQHRALDAVLPPVAASPRPSPI